MVPDELGFGVSGVTDEDGNVGGVALFSSAANDEFCVRLGLLDRLATCSGVGVGGVRLADGNF